MILIGNGPIPFAVTGQPGAASNASGTQARSAAAQNGAAPEATIPAADPKRTGQTPRSSEGQSRFATRAVVATSRTEAVVTNPEDRPRLPGTGAAADDHLEPARPPVAPLTSYASIPTEVMAEIQRLRAENAELKEELAERDKSNAEMEETSPETVGSDTEADGASPGGEGEPDASSAPVGTGSSQAPQGQDEPKRAERTPER